MDDTVASTVLGSAVSGNASKKRPRVFVSYAYDNAEHVAAVLRLSEELAGAGVDVVVDQWARPHRRNWGEWTTDQILETDFTIVVASAGFKRAAEGHARRDDHRGVQAEAALLRDLLQADRYVWRTRILPVILPGRSIAEIPVFLSPYSETHYLVPELSTSGISDLLQAIRCGMPDDGDRPAAVASATDSAARAPSRRSGWWFVAAAAASAGLVVPTVTRGALGPSVLWWTAALACSLTLVIHGLWPRSTVEADRAVPKQLPIDIPVFVGRQRELKQIHHHARRGGVVSIAGKPGVGKSALALHAAHTLVDRYPDGQIYIDLQGMRGDSANPAGVLCQILQMLGATPESEDLDPLSRLYRSMLADRKMLIVLDDAASSTQVAPLLPGARSCLVLITSRRPLADLHAAPSPLVLGTFDENEALTLLSDLAGGKRIQAEPSEAATVARYCGYLPLALRIVGGRLAARPNWSIRYLASRLAQEHSRLRELKLGDLEVRACIHLSYADLGAADSATFRRLSAIPGGDFGPDIALAAAGIGPTMTAQAMENLVEAQLVEEFAAERYRLHDLIRLFGQERFEADDTPAEQKATTDRLLAAYTDSVYAAAEALGLGWIADRPAVTGSVPTSTATELVHDYSRADTVSLWLRGEQANLIAAAEANLRNSATGIQALRLAYAVLACLPYSGSYLADLQRLATAAKAAATIHDPGGVTEADYHLAWIQRHRANLPAAIPMLEQCRASLESGGPTRLLGNVLRSLAGCYREAGRYSESIRTAFDAVNVFTAVGDRRAAAGGVLMDLAVVLKDCGRLDEAGRVMRIAITHREAVSQGDARDVMALSWAHENLGAILKRQRKFAEAELEHRKALLMFRAIGQLQGQGYSLRNLGELAFIRGFHTDALGWYEASLEMFRRYGDKRGESQVLASIAIVHAKSRHPVSFATALWRWTISGLSMHEKLATVVRFRARYRQMRGSAAVTLDLGHHSEQLIRRVIGDFPMDPAVRE